MEKTEAEPNLLQDLRMHKRVSVLWNARVCHGENETECRILDVCLTGVGIQLGEELEHGITVEIHISDCGMLAGRVVRSRAGRTAVSLESSPETIRATLLSRARLDEN